MTILTFGILYALQAADVLDPSKGEDARNISIVADWRDGSLPLPGVCEAQSRLWSGVVIFAGISSVSLAGVIFGTSRQSLSGVLREIGCGGSATVTAANAPPPPPSQLRSDRGRGMACLFVTYMVLVLVLMLFFSFTPFYHHDATRNDTGWRDACDAYDTTVLGLYGIY